LDGIVIVTAIEGVGSGTSAELIVPSESENLITEDRASELIVAVRAIDGH
jgi:hypothetical protein